MSKQKQPWPAPGTAKTGILGPTVEVSPWASEWQGGPPSQLCSENTLCTYTNTLFKSKIKEGTSHLDLTAELYEVLENLWTASLGVCVWGRGG